MMRRLLPQTARAMADGSMEGVGSGTNGLSRVDWRARPADQAAAVETFVLAWWQDVLTTPEPPYPVHDVFETCATILGDMTPLLDRFDAHPVTDTHLVSCADTWLYDLITDCSQRQRRQRGVRHPRRTPVVPRRTPAVAVRAWTRPGPRA
ncbi:hypothetical protein [Streptomyces dysideae]|uniref:hypothetical protein n=1 Tax=Streptomyces dysideae TaxID=909626 RepID=UPI001F442697|nr:hypothetical protein [Streptomyces dysideae]